MISTAFLLTIKLDYTDTGEKSQCFESHLFMTKPMGCCWLPHYMRTVALFVPVFSWQITSNCGSVQGGSLAPFETELFHLCQGASPILPKVSKPGNSSEFAPGFSLHPIQWFFTAPSRFENNNPHVFLLSSVLAASWQLHVLVEAEGFQHETLMCWALLIHSLPSPLRTRPTIPHLPLASNVSSSVSFLVPSSFCALVILFCSPSSHTGFFHSSLVMTQFPWSELACFAFVVTKGTVT